MPVPIFFVGNKVRNNILKKQGNFKKKEKILQKVIRNHQIFR